MDVDKSRCHIESSDIDHLHGQCRIDVSFNGSDAVTADGNIHLGSMTWPFLSKIS